MLDKVLISFLVANALFASTGGLLLAVVFITKSNMHRTTANIASNLLLMQTPLNGALFNAGLIFFTFTISLPALILPSNHTWLKLHGSLVVACAVVTLALGLDIWFTTLQTRSNVGAIWAHQSPQDQSMLQQKVGSEFKCCGYLNSQSSPFRQDAVCPTPAAAAQKRGCVGPFSNYTNKFLDLVFTTMFGIVALDFILVLCIAMVLKCRAEKARYRHIDEKNRYDSI